MVFAGQAAAGLGSIIGVRLLTHLLPPAVFGEFALSLTIVMIFQYSYAGTSGAAMRFFVPALEKGQVAAYLKAAWRMQHRRNLLLVPLIVGGTAFLAATGRSDLIPLGAAAVAIAVVTSYGTVMDGLQNAARQRAVVALHQGISSWLRLGIAAMLVAWWSASATSVLWGFALGATVTMASQWVFYRRMKGRLSPCVAAMDAAEIERHWYTSMTSCAWPYVIWCVPVWLRLSSDRWALEWLASPAEVGIYAALLQLAFLPINTLTQLVTQLAMPILFARAGDLTDSARVASSRTLNRRLVRMSLFWTILAVAMAVLLQAPLGHLLLDARYHGFLHLLAPLVLSAGLFAAGQFAQLNTITANRTTDLIWPNIAIGLLGCLTFFAGAYVSGITGVVWGNVVTNAALFWWILRLNRNLPCPEEKPARDHAAIAAGDFTIRSDRRSTACSLV